DATGSALCRTRSRARGRASRRLARAALPPAAGARAFEPRRTAGRVGALPNAARASPSVRVGPPELTKRSRPSAILVRVDGSLRAARSGRRPSSEPGPASAALPGPPLDLASVDPGALLFARSGPVDRGPRQPGRVSPAGFARA